MTTLDEDIYHLQRHLLRMEIKTNDKWRQELLHTVRAMLFCVYGNTIVSPENAFEYAKLVTNGDNT